MTSFSSIVAAYGSSPVPTTVHHPYRVMEARDVAGTIQPGTVEPQRRRSGLLDFASVMPMIAGVVNAGIGVVALVSTTTTTQTGRCSAASARGGSGG
jgi:hypothetical protein